MFGDFKSFDRLWIYNTIDVILSKGFRSYFSPMVFDISRSTLNLMKDLQIC